MAEKKPKAGGDEAQRARGIRRQGHHRPRRARGCPKAPRHVHRLDRPRGLHHLVYEVVDNSVDEALAGHCDAVEVTIHPDSSVTVVDDGRGIPVGDHGQGEEAGRRGRPHRAALRRQVRRRRRLQGLRRAARRRRVGGQRAVGELHVEIKRDGHVWTQDYERGAPKGPLKKGAATKETGTTITFRPDAEIFETLDFEWDALEQRLRETAFLTRGMRIELVDERGEGKRAEFKYDGGIRDFVALPQREQGRHPQEDRLHRGRDRRGRRRGGDAVELLLPGVHLLLRQQHQHARGRLAPQRLPLRPDRHDQPLRAEEGPAQGGRTRTSPARTSARASRR